MPGQRRRIVADHEIPERAALRIEPGDVVEVGDRDTEWPAFTFVSADAGAGWVPERHLSAARPRAVVQVAYDTQELAVAAGDEVEIVSDDAASGWSWCRGPAGDEGWVPHRCLGAESAGTRS
ncbi:SH3 domain-containing protein [Demequina sp. NBRC 110056]|uniref:SH3 domain-containing protein n=1 Tax=Demequina sp. NBRC 110056 TaxID=1570345 RepID=UPI000A002BDE|nr:SH3 domain-containing protein [Demequina sp. NBRC 110056]